VGKDAYNDTFAMTRKDEELLVGEILQKIVVPHPAVTHLEAIEVSEIPGKNFSQNISYNFSEL